jgi:glyoxylase-like metal-dependent hydrolase (beta-lactamase superfamily II)
VPKQTRTRELGRGERVRSGIWRLRLPLPWPGVPHGNAWALAAGDGVVLVDTGTHEPGSMAQLERALDQVGLSLDHVRLLVCTHAHADHYGQAAPIVERTGCELWMHPNIDHVVPSIENPEAAMAARIEVARQGGVPEETLKRYADAYRGQRLPFAELIRPHRPLTDGDEIETDHGVWRVIVTPGHAPSHLCLHQPDHGILISGDHVLGRVSTYYDYGWTPDPAGEFLDSLDKVQAARARLCLSGHGRPFTDVDAHIDATRKLVNEKIEAVAGALEGGPLSAADIVPKVFGQPLDVPVLGWWLQETLCYLTHLEVEGRARRVNGDPDVWTTAD